MTARACSTQPDGDDDDQGGLNQAETDALMQTKSIAAPANCIDTLLHVSGQLYASS